MTTQQKQQLERSYQFYLDNYDKLVEMYDGKVLVLVNGKVADAYPDTDDAYYCGMDKYGLGNFLIQPCSSKQKLYTIRTSPVIKPSSNEFNPDIN